jgi:hypothetical protein
MSPEPLISLQRRLTIVGAIRAGGEKPDRGVGKKLEHWRITSPRRQLVEQASALYGGAVSKWTSPIGEEWQCYTDVDELPVLVMPSYSVRQSYELWEGATKRTRLCDGVEDELSGGPCICNAQEDDKCDLYTRLVVCLPALDTVLGWRLITRGTVAGHELPTMMALINAQAGGATFVPAKLRLDQRKGVKDGQTVRYVVPVLDLAVSYLALAGPAADGSARELPSGASPTPHPPRREPTVEQALSAVAQPASPQRNPSRTAAAYGPVDDLDMDSVRAPAVPSEAPQPQQTTATAPPEAATSSQTKAITDPQARKLNVLVGKLRPDHLTTEHLYQAVAKMRNLDVGIMAQVIEGSIDADGVFHFGPLRDSLTRVEAMQLIDRLVQLEGQAGVGETAGEQPERPASTSAGDADPGPDPSRPLAFGEFPAGY